jgi:hypothetical protein
MPIIGTAKKLDQITKANGPVKLLGWDVTKWRTNTCNVCLAPKDSGKSVLLKDILQWNKERIHSLIVISETEEETQDFDGICAPIYIYNEPTEEIFEKVFNRQRVVKKQLRDNPELAKTVNWEVTIILDDCMSSKFAKESKYFEKLFTIGRHLGITVFVTCQYMMQMLPIVRNNCDYAFILSADGKKVRSHLYELWFSGFKEFGLFDVAMDVVTSNYGVMVYTKRAKNFQEKVTHYKATSFGNGFRVGSADYWNLSDLLYSPNDAATLADNSSMENIIRDSITNNTDIATAISENNSIDTASRYITLVAN